MYENAYSIIALSISDLNQFGILLDGVRSAPLSVLASAGHTVVTIGRKRHPSQAAEMDGNTPICADGNGRTEDSLES